MGWGLCYRYKELSLFSSSSKWGVGGEADRETSHSRNGQLYLGFKRLWFISPAPIHAALNPRGLGPLLEHKSSDSWGSGSHLDWIC